MFRGLEVLKLVEADSTVAAIAKGPMSVTQTSPEALAVMGSDPWQRARVAPHTVWSPEHGVYLVCSWGAVLHYVVGLGGPLAWCLDTLLRMTYIVVTFTCNF